MGDLLLSILLAGIFAAVGVTMFPSWNGMIIGLMTSINSDPVSMFPLLKVGIQFMPYIVLLIVFWAAIEMVKRKVNH